MSIYTFTAGFVSVGFFFADAFAGVTDETTWFWCFTVVFGCFIAAEVQTLVTYYYDLNLQRLKALVDPSNLHIGVEVMSDEKTHRLVRSAGSRMPHARFPLVYSNFRKAESPCILESGAVMWLNMERWRKMLPRTQFWLVLHELAHTEPFQIVVHMIERGVRVSSFWSVYFAMLFYANPRLLLWLLAYLAATPTIIPLTLRWLHECYSDLRACWISNDVRATLSVMRCIRDSEAEHASKSSGVRPQGVFATVRLSLKKTHPPMRLRLAYCMALHRIRRL